MNSQVLGYASARYYRHSGKVPAGAFFLGMITSILGGTILGSLYGWIGFAGHFIPIDKLFIIVEMAAVCGTGAAAGFMSVIMFKGCTGRSTPVAYGFTLATVAVTLYAAWVAWTYSYLTHVHINPGFLYIVRPHVLWRAISVFNQQGVWYFMGDTPPKGALLTIIWLGEMAIVTGIALRITRSQMKHDVFCEHCTKWGTSRHLTAIRAENLGDLQASLEAGNIEALSAATLRQATDTHWAVIDLEGCARCDTLQTLNLAACSETRNKDGKTVIKVKQLIHRMLLTPEQTVQLAMIASTLGAKVTPAIPEADLQSTDATSDAATAETGEDAKETPVP